MVTFGTAATAAARHVPRSQGRGCARPANERHEILTIRQDFVSSVLQGGGHWLWGGFPAPGSGASGSTVTFGTGGGLVMGGISI